jgi:heme exporter protein D
MDSIATFLQMGGYAVFVWPAYAVAAAVLIALLVQARRELARNRRTLTLLESQVGQRRRPGGSGSSAP